MSVLKRYLVFAGLEYYPTGGWGDFIGSTDNIPEAFDLYIKQNKLNHLDWVEIVDTETGKKVLPINMRLREED